MQRGIKCTHIDVLIEHCSKAYSTDYNAQTFRAVHGRVAWQCCLVGLVVQRLVGLLDRVSSGSLGRVARVNAGRTAVATGDRGRLTQYKPSRVLLEFFLLFC